MGTVVNTEKNNFPDGMENDEEPIKINEETEETEVER